MKVARSELKEVCAGERPGPATRVESRATSGKTAGRQERKTKEGSKEETVKEKKGFITSRKDIVNKDLEDKVVFDRSEERLDELEGKLEEEEEVCLMFEEDDKVEDKVHDTLRNHVGFWRQSGASDFAVSVIENGYVPQMQRKPE